MSYVNPFLRDFSPMFLAILKARDIKPEKAALEVIDEGEEEYCVFEEADVRDVLEQIAPGLNFLTIYTDRPAYFEAFAETMYEENGLIVTLLFKRYLRMAWQNGGVKPDEKSVRLVLDFEWEGSCYAGCLKNGGHYIPIHKKPWEVAENLDIIVPLGYNTMIVKGLKNRENKPMWDRFEMAFYEGK